MCSVYFTICVFFSFIFIFLYFLFLHLFLLSFLYVFFCGCVTICHFNYLLRHQDASLTCIFFFLAGKFDPTRLYEYTVCKTILSQLYHSLVVFFCFHLIRSRVLLFWTGVCADSYICQSGLLHGGRKVGKLSQNSTNSCLITILVPGYLAWKLYNM